MTRVHYFYDPMCGWCYGATALVEELAQHATAKGWEMVLHPGGMIARRAIDNGFRQHILQADQRIAGLTGAEFGEPYRQRVASPKALVLDSMLPTQAILCARELGLDELQALKAIQQAHYQQGLDVANASTLQELMLALARQQSIELAEDVWKNAWQDAMANGPALLNKTLSQSQRLMQQFGVQGFPTLLLESDQGWQSLPHSRYYGNVEGWRALLAGVSR